MPIGSAGFSAMPFTLSFKGSYFNLSNFFTRLERFVTVENNNIDVTGRLLLLGSISVTPQASQDGKPGELVAQVGAATYLVPPADGRRRSAGPGRRGRRARRERDHHSHDHRDDHWSPMSPLSNLWRQLVERRLWPVAVLLIAALAAVPLVLAKEPEAEPAPAPQATTGESSSSELATAPIVALATDQDRNKRRKVLGKAKNPFAKPASSSSTDSGPTAVDQANDTAANAGGGIDLTIGGGEPPTAPSAPIGGPVGMPVPAPTEPDSKPVRRERHSVTVRFGDGDALERMNVKKLEDLPLGEEPLVVYLGVADGGKSAVFLVDSTVSAEGDGECMPDPSSCETIHLSEGETEFFDVLDENGEPIAQYQLDLIEIHGGKKKSSAGRTASAKGSGPGALQDRADTAGVARTADAGLGLALPLP